MDSKPKARKRLTDEERAEKARIAEEKRQAAAQKKALALKKREIAAQLKAAKEEHKRQMEELSAIAAVEDMQKRCENVKDYTAKMKTLIERRKNRVNLRQSTANLNESTNELPGGCMRSPPGNDVIYEDEELRSQSAEDSETEDEDREPIDWDSLEIPE